MRPGFIGVVHTLVLHRLFGLAQSKPPSNLTDRERAEGISQSVGHRHGRTYYDEPDRSSRQVLPVPANEPFSVMIH